MQLCKNSPILGTGPTVSMNWTQIFNHYVKPNFLQGAITLESSWLGISIKEYIVKWKSSISETQFAFFDSSWRDLQERTFLLKSNSNKNWISKISTNLFIPSKGILTITVHFNIRHITFCGWRGRLSTFTQFFFCFIIVIVFWVVMIWILHSFYVILDVKVWEQMKYSKLVCLVTTCLLVEKKNCHHLQTLFALPVAIQVYERSCKCNVYYTAAIWVIRVKRVLKLLW